MNTVTEYRAKAWNLAITYVVMVPLIFLAVHGSFSFDYESFNNPTVGYAAPLVVTQSTSPTHSIEIAIAYGIVAFLVMRRYRAVLDCCLKNKALIALPLLALLSAMWSQDRLQSLIYSVMAALITAFGLYITIQFEPEEQMQLLAMLGLTVMASSVLLVAFLPSPRPAPPPPGR